MEIPLWIKWFFFIFIACCQTIVSGEIYKYKDENGNWYYTDTPREYSDELEQLKGVVPHKQEGRDLQKMLFEKYNPKTDIQKASIGTVTVFSAMGKGSGFFINENGYIISNKHVIKGDERQNKRNEEYYNDTDLEIKNIKQYFYEEEKKLTEMKKNLKKWQEAIQSEGGTLRKKKMEEKYLAELKRYNRYKKELENKKKRFKNQKRQYDEGKNDYKRRASLARVKRNFKIMLKDDTELQAYLVAASKDHDLVLLKLDGYKTPYIETEDYRYKVQGERVYAVGSPIGLRDSVCAGIISGFTDDYIKTDAKIYPGNSGGPLITKEGKVIGINTLKMITYKFEGLGFAIPVTTALKEFDPFIDP